MPYVERVTKAGNTIEIERYFTSRYKKKGISRGDKVKPTKEEQEKVNTRQAERKLRILINANYGYGDYHLVLDYIRRKGEPDRTPEQMRQDIDVFLRECRKEYRKAGLEFKYIHVMEIGKKGARHHHLVVNKIDTEILQRCWYKAYEGHNRVKVFPLDDSGNYAELASISTAGYINDSIYDELMKRSTSFLKGNSKERRLLPFLYMIDDVEKWNDIDELKKANPNMGVSVKESFFMDEIAVAEGSLSKKAEFLTKYCNIKQNSSIAWLEYQTVENAGVEKTLEDFRDCYAVGGIDLSQTTDLTAASVVIQKDGTLYAFTQFFMPRGRLEYLQATDGVPYDIFVKKGLITLSGENYVDYHDVYDWFTMLLEDYGIRPLKIGYDRYSAQYLITDMANYGFHMDDVYQGENLTPVIREFEGIIKDGDFKIADNNLLKTHFLNVALKHNMETRKFRPIKIEQRAHIDGFVSVIDAMTVRQKYWEECGELLKNAA